MLLADDADVDEELVYWTDFLNFLTLCLGLGCEMLLTICITCWFTYFLTVGGGVWLEESSELIGFLASVDVDDKREIRSTSDLKVRHLKTFGLMEVDALDSSFSIRYLL